MGKKVYHDSDKIRADIGVALEMGITTTKDLKFYLKNSTGYELSDGAINNHVREYQKNEGLDTNWLEIFARSKVLKTARTHLNIFEKIRNDLFLIYQKKSDLYKKCLDDGVEPDPMLLTEILEIQKALEGNMDGIEKRHVALLFILPIKVSFDKVDNRAKLENSDPTTRNAILVADYEAEQLENEKRQLRDLTEVHGEGNEVA